MMALSSSTTRRLIALLTLGAVAGVVMSLMNPVNATLYRLMLLGSLFAFWMGSLVLFWKWKIARVTMLVLAALCVIPFLLPGHSIPQDELRTCYLARMKAMEGSTYHWGGESPRGIDCSGLPRRAIRDALFLEGIKHANGDAFRQFAEQWWYDTSAEALGQGYRGSTVTLHQSGMISTMSYAGLEPGDLAVTVSGVHVLVYLGDRQWIQADPGIGFVATLDGRKDKNPWFHQPVTMHRWTVLADE